LLYNQTIVYKLYLDDIDFTIMRNVIKENNKGRVFYDVKKNIFLIEFGNIEFSLTMEEFSLMEKELSKLTDNSTIFNSPDKIKLEIKNSKINLLLSAEDLISLQDLFGIEQKRLTVFKLKINYSMN